MIGRRYFQNAFHDSTSLTLLSIVAAVAIGLITVINPLLLGIIALLSMVAISPAAALLSLLILSPMRTLIATEAPVQLPLDIGQIAFVILIGAWIVHRIAAKEPLIRLRWSKLYIPLVAWVIASGLTAFTALSMGSWITEWLKWVIVLILMALVLDNGHLWRWLVFGLVMAGVANAVIGLYTFLGGSGALHLLINNRFFRAFGTFGQPNPFGGFMGLLAPLAVMTSYGYLLRVLKNRRDVNALVLLLFYAGAAGLIIVGVIISWSRGAWLGFGVSMMVVVFALPRR